MFVIGLEKKLYNPRRVSSNISPQGTEKAFSQTLLQIIHQKQSGRELKLPASKGVLIEQKFESVGLIKNDLDHGKLKIFQKMYVNNKWKYTHNEKR